MDREEYTSDEGNYSSLSSASGFSTFEDETDFRGSQLGSTDAEKHLLLQLDKCKQNIWRKHDTPTKHTIIDDNLLQKINHELEVQNLALERNNIEWKLKFEVLQKEIDRLNGDKECRESCILQLKNKIAEQQENIHELTQQNFKFNIDVSTLNNELTTTKGTVDWYKNEWTNTNNERNVLQKELYLLKNSLRNKKLEITRLEAQLEALVQDVKQFTNKTTEKLIQQPVILVETKENQEKPTTSDKEAEINTKYYLAEIEDLSKEISTVRKSLSQQTEVLSQLLKDKTELVKEHTVLQREFDNEKVIRFSCEEKIKKLHETNEYYLETIKRKDRNALELKTEKSKLKIELQASIKEKLLIQETINSTRNKFHKLVTLQDELKEELKVKDKIILTLEKKIQDSFMYENWNKCAIEEFAMKEENYTKQIKTLEGKVEDSEKLKLEIEEIKKYCKSVMAEKEKVVSDCKLHEQLELRCVNMALKNANAEDLITKLQEEIKTLHDALHIKQVQMNDKQTRYESHYRTLLKQVKQFKRDANVTHIENMQLKNQQQNMIEELNTKKLQLFQSQIDLDSATNRIKNNSERISCLQSVLKDKEDILKEERVIGDELRNNYELLVSTHSKCLSTIETTKKMEQEKLDNDKIANCTIVNTQHALIEKLENEKSNALIIIKSLEGLNQKEKAQVQDLLREKLFLQRLVVDMKAALNAHAAKQKYNMRKPLVVPLDLTKYSCPILANEREILTLCESKGKTSINLKESVLGLQKEMTNMKCQLKDVKHIE